MVLRHAGPGLSADVHDPAPEALRPCRPSVDRNFGDSLPSASSSTDMAASTHPLADALTSVGYLVTTNLPAPKAAKSLGPGIPSMFSGELPAFF